MKSNFEINKELECKQLLWSKLEGNDNNESYCIIYLTVIV